jgi:ribosomal protein S18 acetylase RimI-like enzyme
MTSLVINYYLLIYFLIAVIVVYVILTAYIKIKLRFWRTQPVFHIYNLLYWIKPPGIISQETDINRYMNHINIKTFNISDMDELTLNQFCNFIKNYYVVYSSPQNSDSVETNYTPTKNNILGYLEGANHPSFITLYQQPEFLYQNGLVVSSINSIKGVISARTLTICLKGVTPFSLYYVDNLCVHPEVRKKGIAPEIIQTHYYNLRKNNEKIMTCLFKREGELNAIVPLTTYITTSYDISNLIFPLDTTLHASIKIIEIGVLQLSLLVDFIQSLKPLFDCVIMPDITNLVNMIKTENIIIYGVITNGKLLSIYVFRNIQLYYNGRRAIECIMSLYTYNKDIFVSVFNISLGKLREKLKNDIIIIEDTAHSGGLIANFKMIGVPVLFKSPTAFFLYNYACYSVPCNKFLILY